MTNDQHPVWGATTELIPTDGSAHAIRRENRRIQRGIYADPSVNLTPIDLIRAAAMRAGPGAVVAGTSAAILHGTQFIEVDGVEMIRDRKGQGRRFDDVRILRTDRLATADVEIINGLTVTNPIRTAYDLGRRTPDWKALARLDDLARVSGLDLRELWAYIRDHPRARGICQIRELIKHIDAKAESPGESWLRLLIIKSGLPRPEAQFEVLTPSGDLLARLDLCYRRLKIAIEYDGVEHHTSAADRAKGAVRDNQLRDQGWEPIHVTGERMAKDPDGVIAQIEEIRAIRERQFGPDL